MSPDSFLQAAAELEDLSQGAVEAALGLRLTPGRTSGAWQGFTAGAAGPFSGFELRSPGPSARFGGLLIARFARPAPLGALAPSLDPLRLLRVEPNPPGGPAGAGRWYQLGPHELAVSVLRGTPETVEALSVHGAYP